MTRVVVWGTGNVGRPAIRAVAAHRDLELAGVIVANPDKVGVDAGVLAGLEPLGVAATDDIDLAERSYNYLFETRGRTRLVWAARAWVESTPDDPLARYRLTWQAPENEWVAIEDGLQFMQRTHRDGKEEDDDDDYGSGGRAISRETILFELRWLGVGLG